MKELLALSPILLSQIDLSTGLWERLGLGALGFLATIYIYKRLQAKEDERQKTSEDALRQLEERRVLREVEDAKERNRLLSENNRLNAQVIDVLLESQKSLLTQGKDFKMAVEDGQRSIKELIRTYNKPCHKLVDVLISEKKTEE